MKPTNPFLPTFLFSLFAYSSGVVLGGQLALTIRDQATGESIPARVHLYDPQGRAVRPPGLPFWNDHFVCSGAVTLDLGAGRYRWQVERGPEWSVSPGVVDISREGTVSVTNVLVRVVDLAAEGWWGGETHVHRDPREVELLMRAEDLHVAQVITWWNRANPWTNAPIPTGMPVRFDRDRFYNVLGGEDERDGGALLFMDTPSPIDITRATRDFPSSLTFARESKIAGTGWIDAEKPFWWDFPMWVAHNIVDSVGLANNHMYRLGAMDNEAWGRPRDRNAYPGPQGNGRYSQDIYYHLLNCGIRLAPSAGSASGVLPNPVGYNRVYVYVPQGFSYQTWFDGLKQGRSFVSNGPLLRCTANGQAPGHIFHTNGPLNIQIEGRLDSRDKIAVVEIVRNGQVERATLPARFVMSEGGWFLVRVIADVPNTFRFASTAPWYVEIGGRPIIPRRDSAQYFIQWCQERIAKINSIPDLTADQRVALLEPWQAAIVFWQGKLVSGVLLRP